MIKRIFNALFIVLIFCSIAGCGQKQMPGPGKVEATPTWEEQYNLGVRYLSEGNYEEAIIAFTAAIDIDSKKTEAYIGLADVYTIQGDTDKAIEILNQALDAAGESEALAAALEALEAKTPPQSESEPKLEPEPESDPEPELELEPLAVDISNQADLDALPLREDADKITDVFAGSADISDICALSGLSNLTFLDLQRNTISDISALSGLSNLKWLYLNDNNISDISALSELTDLEWLYLSENSVSDVTALSGLTNLTMLWLVGNDLSQQQIDALESNLPDCLIFY